MPMISSETYEYEYWVAYASHRVPCCGISYIHEFTLGPKGATILLGTFNNAFLSK
jgi:hypothetical protein